MGFPKFHAISGSPSRCCDYEVPWLQGGWWGGHPGRQACSADSQRRREPPFPWTTPPPIHSGVMLTPQPPILFSNTNTLLAGHYATKSSGSSPL